MGDGNGRGTHSACNTDSASAVKTAFEALEYEPLLGILIAYIPVLISLVHEILFAMACLADGASRDLSAIIHEFFGHISATDTAEESNAVETRALKCGSVDTVIGFAFCLTIIATSSLGSAQILWLECNVR